MRCPLFTFASEAPKALALIDEERKYSACELNTLVEEKSKMVESGICIPFLGHTNIETIVLLFALWRKGGVAFPLNTRDPSFPLTLPSEVGADIFLKTSGSTTTPKVTPLTIDNFYYNALGALPALNLGFQDRWLLSLPLFHVGGISILFRCFLAKATVVIGNAPVTHVSFVPTQLYRLLKENKPLNYKCILLGGAPIPDAYLKIPNVTPTYGMTETASIITLDGVAPPHRTFKLALDGEILVKGKTLFRDEWFATKDLGMMKDGKLHIIGRKDNLFISGGENIQPEEIEAAIFKHCGAFAIVVPVPDPEWGERPVAFTDGPISLDLLRPHLAKYKIPLKILPLPKEAGLKPNRKALAAQAKYEII